MQERKFSISENIFRTNSIIAPGEVIHYKYMGPNV